MVAKVSAVEKELQEATGVKKKVAEKFQKYAVRLINAVQELKDPEWETLSTETQEWVNDGAKAIKAEGGRGRLPPEEDEAEELKPRKRTKRRRRRLLQPEPAAAVRLPRRKPLPGVLAVERTATRRRSRPGVLRPRTRTRSPQEGTGRRQAGRCTDHDQGTDVRRPEGHYR
jgi:hypothetical protein